MYFVYLYNNSRNLKLIKRNNFLPVVEEEIAIVDLGVVLLVDVGPDFNNLESVLYLKGKIFSLNISIGSALYKSIVSILNYLYIQSPSTGQKHFQIDISFPF